MAMAMGKLMNSVMKMKYLVISISVKNPKLTKSISSTPNTRGILLKRLVTKEDSGNQENILSFLKYPVTNADDAAVENIDLPCFKDSPSLEIRGHSHGIVCLSDCYQDPWLLNPATRKFNKLPQSTLVKKQPIDPDIMYNATRAEGFGYDPKSKGFKVVRVMNFWGNPKQSVPNWVEVYDISTDEWREINVDVPANVLSTPSSEMYHDGFYYWWAAVNDKKQQEDTILSFDMTREVFRTLPLPRDFVMDGNDRSLIASDTSILLFNYPARGDEKSFDIWGRKYNDDDTWVKLWTIGPLPGVVRPLLFLGSDEILMEAKDGQVISYNFRTNEVQNLPIKGKPDRFQCLFFNKTSLSI